MQSGLSLRAALLLAGFSLAASPVQAADPVPDYPGDPLAHERAWLPPVEVGSARGQTHLFALGALVKGDNSPDIYFGGQLGIEFQLHEFGAIRLSGFQDLVDGDGQQLAHKFSSVRIGPALHLRPYHRVDLGAYFEGGVLVVDAVDGRTSARAPEIVTGGFISVHIDPHAYVQLELEQSWSNVEINGVLGEHDQLVAKMGLGVVF